MDLDCDCLCVSSATQSTQLSIQQTLFHWCWQTLVDVQPALWCAQCAVFLLPCDAYNVQCNAAFLLPCALFLSLFGENYHALPCARAMCSSIPVSHQINFNYCTDLSSPLVAPRKSICCRITSLTFQLLVIFVNYCRYWLGINLTLPGKCKTCAVITTWWNSITD